MNNDVRFYRVRWPNGDVELFIAQDDEDLFFMLDEIESPYDLEIEEVEIKEPLKISLRQRLKTLTDLMKLPVKRTVTPDDLDMAFAGLYGNLEPQKVCYM